MSADSKSFAARLHQFFDLDEVAPQDRVRRLARAGAVTKPTARRSLSMIRLGTGLGPPAQAVRCCAAHPAQSWDIYSLPRPLMGRAADSEAWRALKALQLVKGYAVKRTVFLAALGDPIVLQTVQRYEVG